MAERCKGKDGGPLDWFASMIDHCYNYAAAAKKAGRPVVGIMCEYTPREVILAAGAVPVCLCGGDVATIGPAEAELPSNLCPLIKSTYGYFLTKSNPFLEMADLIVAETTCDGKKKMYELMGRSKPMYVLELPHRQDGAEAMEFWAGEIVKLKEHLERQFGVKITKEKLHDAIAVMNRERHLRRQLAELMKVDNPPLTGRQLLELKSSISGIPADLEQYERVIELYGKAGAAGGKADGRVRVLMTGVPTVHGAEKVVDIIENSGGLIVCMENCTGIKPILEDVDERAADPLRAIAEKYFHLPCSVQSPNKRRIESLRQLVAEYRPQCIIELVWHACLTYDVESATIRKLAGELGLPYLLIGTDYSPSDSARIATRVEALLETVKR